MPDEFLTVDDVAQLLKLNPQTVRNMIDRGDLPAIRVGARRVRIERSDLDAFLAQGRRLTQRTDTRVAFDLTLACGGIALIVRARSSTSPEPCSATGPRTERARRARSLAYSPVSS